jgi:hypothetical protein
VNTPFIRKQHPRDKIIIINAIVVVDESFQKLLDMDLTLEDERLERLTADIIGHLHVSVRSHVPHPIPTFCEKKLKTMSTYGTITVDSRKADLLPPTTWN